MTRAQMKPLQVGLLGIGTVGLGTWMVARRNEGRDRAPSRTPDPITWIAERARSNVRGCDPGADGGQPDRRRDGVLGNRDIDIVIELIGGLEPARTFILQAIENGKHVVTANKALLARHGNEIFAAAHRKGVMVAFEGAVAGRRSDHQGVARGTHANRIEWIAGHHQRDIELHPVGDAREGRVVQDGARRGAGAGLCRSRPDVRHRGDRRRAQAHHHVGDRVRRSDAIDKVYTEGISKLTGEDIRYAEELGYRIKLLASRGARRPASSCACIRRSFRRSG
jgi:homoserine dehydrogenase